MNELEKHYYTYVDTKLSDNISYLLEYEKTPKILGSPKLETRSFPKSEYYYTLSGVCVHRSKQTGGHHVD